jgi:hypothetical protein
MQQKLITFIVLMTGFVWVFNSCKHELPLKSSNDSDTTIINPATNSCNPDSVYFTNDIQPLIVSTCAISGCHNQASHKEGIVLDSYTNIMREVVAGNASNSRLYKIIIRTDEDRMPPAPYAAYTAAQVNLIKKWINQGAKNNSCLRCDSTDFSYSGFIEPLINSSCKGCHSTANAGGGYDLSTYNGVKAIALSGKLIGSISWSTGFSRMPQGSAKLSECQVNQVKKWIDAGAPNN